MYASSAFNNHLLQMVPATRGSLPFEAGQGITTIVVLTIRKLE
jgi:hypothetical protein